MPLFAVPVYDILSGWSYKNGEVFSVRKCDLSWTVQLASSESLI